MRACLCVPPLEEYPWRPISAGLERLGYSVEGGMVLGCDILVVWSPWHASHRHIIEKAYRASGKPVIVMENGWLSPIGRAPTPFFQVALGGWNGTGQFQAGGPERWKSWAVPERPWTIRSGPALIVGQRGHPYDRRTAPPGWHETLPLPDGCTGTIRRGRDTARPLGADLTICSQAHVWTSNAASWAIVAGVPVIQYGPNLMVTALASRPGEPVVRPHRTTELERLAWAQWNLAEIETGEPFARLLVAA